MNEKECPAVKFWEQEDHIFYDLHTAASLGCDDRVHDLIKGVASPSALNEQNRDGWTPLMFSAFFGRSNVVSILLAGGADANVKNLQGQTALMLAAKCGNLDSSSCIIDSAADIDIIDYQGWSALYHAASAGHRNAVQLFLKKGCRTNIIDSKGFTPLMIAVQAGHEMIVKDLLENGACPLLSGDAKQSARSLAVEKKFTKIQGLIDANLSAEKNSVRVLGRVELPSVLESLGLAKYYPIFEKNEIDWSTFRNLSNEDLLELGIGLLGPRKKILAYVSKYQKHLSPSAVIEEKENEKLQMEYKHIQQELAELKKLLAEEKKCRSECEKHLSETLANSKCLSEKVSTVATHVVSLLQVLRKALDKHKGMLLSSAARAHHREMNAWNQAAASLQSIDSIFNEICMSTRTLLR